MAGAFAVTSKAATAFVGAEVAKRQLTDRHGDVPGHLLLDDLLLFNHADGFPLHLLELELDFLLDNGPLDLSNQLNSLNLGLHDGLLRLDHLGDDLHFGSVFHLLYHVDPGLRLLLLPDNSLLLLDRLHFVPDLRLGLGLLLEHESLDCFFLGPEHLLLSFDSLHFPLCFGAESVLVLLVHVTVLVSVHLVAEALDFAVALVSGAAGSLSSLGPVSASLVVAAAATPSSLARLAALAVGVRGVLQLTGVELPVATVGELRGVLVAPAAPPVHVVAADAADQVVIGLQGEGRLEEVGHIDGPRGEGAGNDGEVGVDAVLALALHLGLVEGAARNGRVPGHLLLGAEGSVRRNRDRIHLLRRRVAG